MELGQLLDKGNEMNEIDRLIAEAEYKVDMAFTALMKAMPKDREAAKANLDQARIERNAFNWEPEATDDWRAADDAVVDAFAAHRIL